jgi:anti-sigma regulatory factor (Ser/Thr protein kinase)
MARIALAPVTQWITAAALRHGEQLPAHVMARLGLARRPALALLRRLAELQWLQIDGTPRRRRYGPGPLRQVVQRYTLAGLQEDEPWRRDFAPCFALPANVQRMARHAFTELLNNAVDHSGGSRVTVSMRQTPLQLQLLVSDDGCGLFQRIEERFAIDEPALAMLELSEGGLTSDPQRHTGQGLFFTSRLADVFDIHANATAFQCRSWDRLAWRTGRPATPHGTSVYLAIALDTPRTLDGVLQAHRGAAGHGLARTTVPLHLLAGPEGVLASRAEARRAAARLDCFEHAEINFAGVSDIGHGFADELFRVFGGGHPGLELRSTGMNPAVQAVLASVRAQSPGAAA